MLGLLLFLEQLQLLPLAGLRLFQELIDRKVREFQAARTNAQRPAVTKDGVTISVFANVGCREDTERAMSNGAEGIGLYRIEQAYLGRSTPPSREELVSEMRATLVAAKGRSVCVLEKNNQFGGNLQTFVRERTIFDTGVHYIGGLSEGQNLYRYFDYLDILEGLEFKQLNKDGFDIITFDNDEQEYPHAQGYENFTKQLVGFIVLNKSFIFFHKSRKFFNKFTHPLFIGF